MIFCVDCSYPIVANGLNTTEHERIICYFCGAVQKFSDSVIMATLKRESAQSALELGFFSKKSFVFNDEATDEQDMTQVEFLALKKLIEEDIQAFSRLNSKIKNYLKKNEELTKLREVTFTHNIDEVYEDLAALEEMFCLSTRTKVSGHLPKNQESDFQKKVLELLRQILQAVEIDRQESSCEIHFLLKMARKYQIDCLERMQDFFGEKSIRAFFVLEREQEELDSQMELLHKYFEPESQLVKEMKMISTLNEEMIFLLKDIFQQSSECPLKFNYKLNPILFYNPGKELV